jgi:hypothetical protein
VNRSEYEEKCNPEAIWKWLVPHISHEHLMDIKKAPSVEKYLAIAPDVYVMTSMIQAVLQVSREQKAFGQYGQEDEPKVKPYSELTEEEKISEAPLRKMYLAGLRAGRDSAMIEMSNRIMIAMRTQLDQYRLENPEYDPTLVVDESGWTQVD